MQKSIKVMASLALVCIAIVLISGCARSASEPAPPTQTQTIISTPPPSVHTLTTTVPVKVTKTTPAVTRPVVIVNTQTTRAISSPIVLKGVGNQIVRFRTEAPGVVQFKIKYADYLGYVKNCEEKQQKYQLAGSSVDTTLYTGGSGGWYTGTKTFNLLSPGDYSISVTGCWGWQITVDNA